jgi:hypothetical protein
MLGFASKPSPARLAVTAGIVLLTTLAAGAAEKRYGPGVSDSEIKLGQTLHIAVRPRSASPRRPISRC